MDSSYFDQHDYTIRCEWGSQGVAALQPISDVIIIVDVLSFSTCVDVGVHNGALIYPYRWRDETAEQFATSISALLAHPHRTSSTGYSLSPASLRHIPAGTRLVLPSPNGATLSHLTGTTPTLAGCLRNAQSVAKAAQQLGHRIGVIAAGERWPDGSLRPAIEDWIGAGAIISDLAGSRSPEAELASHTFLQTRSNISHSLMSCSSGRELIGRGFAEDVQIATELNVSDTAPIFIEGAYRHS
jgi:2-phosphosulfolactate phosphatase